MDCENIGCRRIGTHSGADENKTCKKVERNGHEIGAAFGSKGQRPTVDIGKGWCARLLRHR